MNKFDEIIERFKAAKEQIIETQPSLDSETVQSEDLEKAAEVKGIHTSSNPEKPGRSTMGILTGLGDMQGAKVQATRTLNEMKKLPKPKLTKDKDGIESEMVKISSNGQWSLEKAKEDKAVPEESRAKFREERNKMSGKDQMEERITSAPGVSPQGIETRRGDPKVPASKVTAHGYGRVTSDPSKHLAVAKDIARDNLDQTKKAPKPKL